MCVLKLSDSCTRTCHDLTYTAAKESQRPLGDEYRTHEHQSCILELLPSSYASVGPTHFLREAEPSRRLIHGVVIGTMARGEMHIVGKIGRLGRWRTR